MVKSRILWKEIIPYYPDRINIITRILKREKEEAGGGGGGIGSRRDVMTVHAWV